MMTTSDVIGRCPVCERVDFLRVDGSLVIHGPADGPACDGSYGHPLDHAAEPGSPTCPLCRRRADVPHIGCVDQLDRDLGEIPGLYAALAHVLEPGATRAARVSGSHTLPLAASIGPLSLRGPGGLIATLASWETDLRRARSLPRIPGRAGREHELTGDHVLGAVILGLRTHLAWAAGNYPAAADLTDEVRQIIRTCKTTLGDLDNGMAIGRCPADLDTGRTCGRVLKAYPNATAIACDRCGTEWPRHTWPLLGATIAQTRTDHAA